MIKKLLLVSALSVGLASGAIAQTSGDSGNAGGSGASESTNSLSGTDNSSTGSTSTGSNDCTGSSKQDAGTGNVTNMANNNAPQAAGEPEGQALNCN